MTRGAPGHFDRDGRPITEDEFHTLHADVAYRVIRQTTVPTPEGRDLQVITSWLGTDQGGGESVAAPLIFGTIGRDSDANTWRDDLEQFHATEGEAVAYHEQVITRLTTP